MTTWQSYIQDQYQMNNAGNKSLNKSISNKLLPFDDMSNLPIIEEPMCKNVTMLHNSYVKWLMLVFFGNDATVVNLNRYPRNYNYEQPVP